MSDQGQNIHITAAGLLLTYWCNARCPHCYELSGPGRRGWMSPEDARRHFANLSRMGLRASGIHVGGGEPFGNYPLLLEVVRAARENGLEGVGYVETNGYWALDEATTRQRLRELREAGMRQISISADAFHQTFVDPECLRRLWSAAREVLGERGVRARRWRLLKSPRDLRFAGPQERTEAYREALGSCKERMTGRAARKLANLLPRFPAETFRGQDCRQALRDAAHVHIDPSNNVFPGTCAGLVLGKAEGPGGLATVLAGPRGQVWRTLTVEGPRGLLAVAKEEGYREEPEGYADKCHLCTGVRTFLFERGRFPGELGPRELYEDDA